MKKTIAGVIIIIFAVAGIFCWEAFGREKILFTEVMVLNQDVEAYTDISQDMLSFRKVYQPGANVLTIRDLHKVVGMQASQYVPSGTELFERYFISPELAVGAKKDEYVFSITTSNLKSYPRSITKGDTIFVYFYDECLLSTTVLTVRDSDGNEITRSDNRATSSGQLASVEIKTDADETATLSTIISNGDPLSIAYK